MKKLIIFGAIIIILGTIFTVLGIRSVTATPGLETPDVILEIDQGGAEVWPSGENTWQRAKDGMSLSAGDLVRTLDNSQVSIIFYDNSVMRLDENTEIKISELSIDPENYLDQDVGAELIVGRAWSRIMNLLDLDSSYEVETSSVVATVRGTAFTMSVDKSGETEVSVTENLVGLTMYPTASGTGEILRQNPRQIKLEAGRLIVRGPYKEGGDISQIGPELIGEEKLKSDWFLKNMNDDEDFIDRIYGLRRDKLRSYIKLLPDSPFFGLQRLGENIGLSLSGEEKKQALRLMYLKRRLAEVAELAHRDKVGLASQELIQLENQLKQPDGGSEADLGKVLGSMLYYQQGFWADVLPVEKSYRLKQKMEELGLRRDISKEKLIYWRLVNLESRLSEAQRLIQFREKDVVTNVLEAARLGLENLKTEAEALPESEQKEIILTKIEYDLKKFGLIQEEIKLLEFQSPEILQPAELELSEEDTEEEMVSEPEDTEAPVEETTDQPTEETPAEETPVEPTEQKTLDTLSVSALPNPINTNSSSDLNALARYTDGSSADVTLGSDWVMYGSLGSIENGVFYSSDTAGSVQVQATYSSGGVTKTASFTMTVKEEATAPKLSSIQLISDRLVLNAYETANLTVVARYTDGREVNVTGSSSFSNSNPSVGYISGSTFNANMAEGSTNVIATYSEEGVTVTDGIVIQVNYL